MFPELLNQSLHTNGIDGLQPSIVPFFRSMRRAAVHGHCNNGEYGLVCSAESCIVELTVLIAWTTTTTASGCGTASPYGAGYTCGLFLYSPPLAPPNTA